MNAAGLILIVFICFLMGYRFYSRYLSQSIFSLRDDEITPAEELSDGSDFVPTQASILWGHHFSSIAGAAPIVGPAVAVIWGWLPALLWIVLGTIFMGAAHDFGSLVVSMRHKGQSLASLSGDLISPRVRNLFLMVVLFLVWMVIAVFALVIANLFVSFPSSVLPVNFQIIVALLIGIFVNRKGQKLLLPAILAQVCLYIAIYLGSLYPIQLDFLTDSPLLAWIVFLLIYSFFASTLPVWALLQPRDYINSHQLIIGLAAIVLGVIITKPVVVAPMFQPHPEGAPSWFPFLFITIACGAISGFHGLVSSGTTSKQVQRWTDARPIGYGAMLGEGTLALLATLAVCAGFPSSEAWHNHYQSWGAAQGLSTSINAFVLGSSSFLGGLGISEVFAQTMMSVLIISFAATSLDTATRIQRYIISEVGEQLKVPALKTPWVSAGLAVLSAFFLMLVQEGGKGGLVLWPLFGAANQMLAALTLIVICAYLVKKQKPIRNFLVPMGFLLVVTVLGLLANISQFVISQNHLLAALASLLLVAEVWIALEAFLLSREQKKT
jgi:carbon starvation protein